MRAGFVRQLALRKAFVLVAVLTCTACSDTSEVTAEEVWAVVARIASSTGFAPYG